MFGCTCVPVRRACVAELALFRRQQVKGDLGDLGNHEQTSRVTEFALALY